jgi:mannitol 2-dehydrogenase
MPVSLSLATLDQLPASVLKPSYRRQDLKPGIVHFGIGNFHRAHQAVYLDLLFNAGKDHDWAIIGAGVRDGDTRMRDALISQDWLTALVELGEEPSSARILGSMIDFIPVDDRERLIATLSQPEIRIVSLTITEGGYFINPATGRFDTTYPEIAADAASPDDPRTVFGLILAGLKRRRAAGIAPFTIMSCDNIPGNGHVAENAVAGLAELIDADLAAYVRKSVAFPNGMVDRITPATTDRERGLLASDYGITDRWPVFCEPFKQWVIEDHFPLGRPRFEDVGVTFVADVAPYELMKIRILNGGHAVIAYPSALMDIHFVHEAMENRLVAAFLEKIEMTEIVPIVPPVPDVDLVDYYKLIASRFANPKVGDTIPRLCLDGSNRQPKFILPSTRDRLQKGLAIDGLALESALWCRYCAGTSDSGRVIAPNDESWARLNAASLAAKADPMAFLAMEDIFGDVARSEIFRAKFAYWLNRLWAEGAQSVLTDYIGS